MIRRVALLALWLGFVAYAFLLAPSSQPDTFTLIQRLSTGDWQGINPLIVALFNLMGVWPMAYSALVLVDGRQQRFPALPFVLLSFGLGAFALLPYLILRQPSTGFSGSRTGLLAVSESRWLGVVLGGVAIALLIYGLGWGSWADFAAQWQSRRFVHVMALDFCLLWLLVPTLLGDDMARRNLRSPALFWGATLVPLVGLCAYLALRPPLADSGAAAAQAST